MFIFPYNTSVINIKSTYKATCFGPIVRPDDGPIGLKNVALYVLLMVIIDVLDGNTNTLYKIGW